MSDLDIAVKARFVNQMGSGARSAERDLKGVRDVAQRLGSADFGNRMRNQLRAAAEGAAALHGKLQSLGGLMVGLGTGYQVLKRTLGAPVMADASYTDRVIDIAQKANIAKEGISGLSDEIKAMATRLKSAPESVAEGIDVLMGSNLEYDVSTKLISPIMKMSKAYRVETGTISDAVFAMVKNLGVAPDSIEVALGRISQAAADGRYEIKNFAEGLPGLAATMKGFDQTGLTGVSRLSAALETVSGSVGDPGQATTYVNQLLQKSLSPDVVGNFKKAGINLQGRIDKAKAEGSDIFEAIYRATMKATGGNTSKVINFFGDEQARGGISALMQNWEQYKEMRDRYEAINSPDKLNSDFAMRLEGTGNTLRTFGERWEAMQTAVGKGVNTYLKPVLDVMSGLLDVFTGLAEKIPAVTGAFAILAATGGAWAMGDAVSGFLKRFGGAGAAAAGATGAATAEATGAGAGAAVAGAGGIWKWLGKGFKVLPKALGWAGMAYSAYEAADWFGSGMMRSLSGAGATGDAAAAREKQRYSDQRRQQLQAKADELQARIAEIVIKGGGNTERGKAQIEYYTDQIAKIKKMMDEIGATEVTPTIDPSSIDAALGKVSALSGALRGLGGTASFTGNASPSFRNNAESASVSRVAAMTSGSKVSTTNNTYNVAGYSPGVVARRVQREQDRQLALSQSGALHDNFAFT